MSLYTNSAFLGDPVFNHFNFDDSILDCDKPTDQGTLQRSFALVRDQQNSSKSRYSIFLEDFWKRRTEIEKSAIDCGFLISDKMEILSKKVSDDSGAKFDNSISAYESGNIELWNEIFVRSFSIPLSWNGELLRREKQILENDLATFVIADSKATAQSQAVGCLLAYQSPEDCLGIYCVGTVPEFRGRGVARTMLSFCDDMAKDLGCKMLTLQTLTSDGVSPMYKKLGYATDFTRDILINPA
jgi:GNAT superfamily N-acetyltransferase